MQLRVHKSQGSEYPAVIIPVGGAPEILLTRNLLYTAVHTRTEHGHSCRRRGNRKKMVANNRQSMRYTGLYRRLASGRQDKRRRLNFSGG
jgi:exodeoxyribonuclease V alpha subunit